MADRIQSIIDSKLSPEKVARDRQNAFEIGFESFIERSEMPAEHANAFRHAAVQGLQELQAQGQ
jgi:hypothetical protein